VLVVCTTYTTAPPTHLPKFLPQTFATYFRAHFSSSIHVRKAVNPSRPYAPEFLERLGVAPGAQQFSPKFSSCFQRTAKSFATTSAADTLDREAYVDLCSAFGHGALSNALSH
jgi:hypothetical protein